MSDKVISDFLRKIEAVISTKGKEKHIFTPGFQGSKHFAQTAPEFSRALTLVASAGAIAAIDQVATNPFWFLIAAATTVALAEQIPAKEDDVSRAICLQRRLGISEPAVGVLLAKVSSGNFSQLSEREFVDAGRRCFILLNECGIEGPEFLFNPIYL